MAGRFPGADMVTQFWENILNREEAISDVPEERWGVSPESVVSPSGEPDKTFTRRAGIIADRMPDISGLTIDPELVRTLDPMHRLVLDVGKSAIDSCASDSIDRQRAGVVLAAIALPTESASLLTRRIVKGALPAQIPGSTDPSPDEISREISLAARVVGFPAALLANALGLEGGSLTLDAACASSLYAIKLACDELLSGRTDVMLAGGVSRPDVLYTQIGFTQLKALSPTGRCAPFDARANGLVVGEGAGIVVLKRLEDALKNKDRILGIIRGLGISNDLEGNLLAPANEGQLRAMRDAYVEAGWSPDAVDLIECHGAGTPVGDAVELNSLVELWKDSSGAPGRCAIGSIKSMIGHLLTAAGAAGIIKVLLALQHSTLPPSLNYQSPPPNSPLLDSPFHVQIQPEPWEQRGPNMPRRAAVSAFGFGGINAHLLLEEPAAEERAPESADTGNRVQITERRFEPIAIVGMGAAAGPADTLASFQQRVLSGTTGFSRPPKERWKGCDSVAEHWLKGRARYGAYMEKLDIHAGEFKIPPRELPDILPQHLVMLKVSTEAMADTGLERDRDRVGMGTIVGIDFDMEATNFHLRWRSLMDEGMVPESLDPDLLETIRNDLSAPLTADRTVGALGSMVASRIAREFRFGGPSFVISDGESSGLKALDLAAKWLHQEDAEAVLVGAVDLSGDVRSVLMTDRVRPMSKQESILPFDTTADGLLPSDGAMALVVKRLDKAVADGNRIYAVLRGLGTANGSDKDTGRTSGSSYMRSLKEAFQDAGVAPDSVELYETHGSGDSMEDRIEADAIERFFKDPRNGQNDTLAISSLKSTLGHMGAASGLASVVKTALCLYQEILPPMPGYMTSALFRKTSGPFHVPIHPSYWVRNRTAGPRSACVASMTADGSCAHAVLEAFENVPVAEHQDSQIAVERRHPMGVASAGLFVIQGNSSEELLSGVDALKQFIGAQRNTGESTGDLAAEWFRQRSPEKKLAAVLIAEHIDDLVQKTSKLRQAISGGHTIVERGIHFTPEPLASTGELALVYPGSGNHYLGMGRELGVVWPDMFRDLDSVEDDLKDQMRPQVTVPYRLFWEREWEEDAYSAMVLDPVNLICSQVLFGSTTTRLVQALGIQPSAAIGYSLGESAALFALGAWPRRGDMLERMVHSDLFTKDIAGPYNAVRKAWQIEADRDIYWLTAVINRPAPFIKQNLSPNDRVRLLIANTPGECVIGGLREDVMGLIDRLKCDAVLVDGVVAVHCDVLEPVKEAYRQLHLLPATEPEGVRFYGSVSAKAYRVTSEAAADAILHNALYGFDFPAVIRQAYEDGVRVFLEMGPQASCSRMIRQILEGQPHVAVSIGETGKDGLDPLLSCLGTLITEGVPVDLTALFDGDPAGARTPLSLSRQKGPATFRILGSPAIPSMVADIQLPTGSDNDDRVDGEVSEIRPKPRQPPPKSAEKPPPAAGPLAGDAIGQVALLAEASRATTEAHEMFLDLSRDLTQALTDGIEIQQRLAHEMASRDVEPATPADAATADADDRKGRPNAFDRDMCMEFAIGSAAKVLGPEFAKVDTYPVRVRLPDEPLMLVDRILSVEGEKASLSSGRLVTEHDVHSGAWYLDGGKAPVCISVEAGQADLFMCAYLGIDLEVKGKRAYRLLDATVSFHRGLPEPGEVIRYEIEIEKFVRQGDTWLFFFHFDGFIGEAPLITMTDGCAGFFTEEEIRNSGGILLTDDEKRTVSGKRPPDWQDLVPIMPESYTSKQLDALRHGRLEDCFGAPFKHVSLSEGLCLPGGRMRLIDRVVELDPTGGRYGLGIIRAEADIHPDDWFLTCHFVDDMVMPGTLMYECCAHTLRVFLQRMGWVTDTAGAAYEPVLGTKAVLKCRGPVTPATQNVLYEVELREIGYDPEPYAIADANMYADGQFIVRFDGMSMRLSGTTRQMIEDFWNARSRGAAALDAHHPSSEEPLYTRQQILEFAEGAPSKAFGEPYRIFDNDRFIARLPARPYSFMDRVVKADAEPWVLKPGGWVISEFDIHPDDWYFKANRTPSLPFCVLLEAVLQPCGWLAAYAGTALTSDVDMHFRNLGGAATLYRDLLPEAKRLTMMTRMNKVATAGNMVIQDFEFQAFIGSEPLYTGTTNFGFFTKEALAQQKGIRQSDAFSDSVPTGKGERQRLADIPPLTPDDSKESDEFPRSLPARALRMIDTIDIYDPDGGRHGLGYVRGTKTVDPDEWFFKAHFVQDPACPGSLGLESFLQLLKVVACERWPELDGTHRIATLTDKPHTWQYRGQILRTNRVVEVEAHISHVEQEPYQTLVAEGALRVDGLIIYSMADFGIRLVPL